MAAQVRAVAGRLANTDRNLVLVKKPGDIMREKAVELMRTRTSRNSNIACHEADAARFEVVDGVSGARREYAWKCRETKKIHGTKC